MKGRRLFSFQGMCIPHPVALFSKWGVGYRDVLLRTQDFFIAIAWNTESSRPARWGASVQGSGIPFS